MDKDVELTADSMLANPALIRQIVDAIPDRVFIKDANGRFILVNKALALAYNKEPKDIEGKHQSEIMAVPGESGKLLEDDVEVVTSGKPKHIQEEKITDGVGRGRLLRTTKIPLRLPSDKGNLVFGISSDITDKSIRERNARIERDIAIGLSKVSDLMEAAALLLDKIAESECVDSGGIYVANEFSGDFEMLTYRNVSQEFAKHARNLTLNDQTHLEALRRGEPYFQNLQQIFDESTARAWKKEKLRMAASFPIMFNGAPLAVLRISSHQMSSMPDSTRHLLEAVAAQVGGVVAKMRMLEERRRGERDEQSLRERMAMLIRGSAELTKAPNMKEFSRSVVETGYRALFKERCSLWLLEDDNPYHCHGTFGVDESGKIRDEIGFILNVSPGSLAYQAISTQEMAVSRDATLCDHRLKIVGKGHHVVAPLIDENKKVYGYLSFDNCLSGKPFSQHDLMLVELYASTVTHLVRLKRAEERLRLSEKQYHDLFNQMIDCVALYKAVRDEHGDLVDFEIAEVNQAYEKVYTVSSKSLIGKRLSNILPPSEKSWLEILIDAFHGDEPCSFNRYSESINKHLEGMIYKPEAERLATIFLDVSQRAEIQKEIRRLVSAIEQAAESFVVMNPEGYIEYVNKAFEEITGYDRDEVIGKKIDVLRDSREPGQYDHIWETIQEGGAWRGRVVSKKKDGGLFQEEVIASPIQDASGKVVNYVAVKRDITAELQMEYELREAKKIESLGRLAGGIAHDLNNLLVPMLGYADLALAEVGEGQPLHENLSNIHSSASRMRQLTRQLLAFSSKQVLEMNIVNVNEVITSFEDILRLLLRENVKLTFNFHLELGPVNADVTQIEQAVMNLVINARDAMPDGGAILISTTNIHVDGDDDSPYKRLRAGEYVAISVKDTGGGISDEVKSHLFEPFFTTKKGLEVRGSGLGLATVRGIVRQHGGEIFVESTIGLGTEFVILIPKVMAAKDTGKTATTKGAERKNKAKGGGETILLVEDDAMVLTLVTKVLASKKYNVVTASNGEDAIASLEKLANIDLLLSDVIMPGMNGKQLLDTVRQTAPNVRVLFMSGYTDDIIGRHGLEEDGLMFIQKPFSVKELIEKVALTLQ